VNDGSGLCHVFFVSEFEVSRGLGGLEVVGSYVSVKIISIDQAENEYLERLRGSICF
jgi:hypothetical protein